MDTNFTVITSYFGLNVGLGPLLASGIPAWRRCWAFVLDEGTRTVWVGAHDSALLGVSPVIGPFAAPSSPVLSVPPGFSDVDADLATFVLADELRARRLQPAIVPNPCDADGEAWRDRVGPQRIARAYAWRLGRLEDALRAREASNTDPSALALARFRVEEAAGALDFHLSWYAIDGL